MKRVNRLTFGFLALVGGVAAVLTWLSIQEKNRSYPIEASDLSVHKILELSQLASDGNIDTAQTLANFYAARLDAQRSVYWYRKYGHRNISAYEKELRDILLDSMSKSIEPDVVELATNGHEQSLMECYMGCLGRKQYSQARKWHAIALEKGFSWSSKHWAEFLKILELIEEPSASLEKFKMSEK